MANSPSTYTLGHSAAVLASHRQRTVHNSAGFLLPHLAPHFALLDVGCGPGSITVGFADLLVRGSVVGVDLAPDVVDAARRTWQRANLTFEVADVAGDGGLAYADDSFDVVYTHQTLIHVPDAARALAELRRVLRPGGILATRECTNVQWWPADPALDLWAGAMQRMMTESASTATPAPNPRALGLLNKGALLALLPRAGFDRARIVVGVGSTVFATADERAWWAGVLLGRLRGEAGAAAKWLKAGFLTDQQVDQLSKALGQWAEAQDAWYVAVQSEILAWK